MASQMPSTLDLASTLDAAVRLHGLGAEVVVTDPQALENARRVHPQLNYELDRFAALAELGWRTTRSFAEACRDAWAWQSANPRGYRG